MLWSTTAVVSQYIIKLLLNRKYLPVYSGMIVKSATKSAVKKKIYRHI